MNIVTLLSFSNGERFSFWNITKKRENSLINNQECELSLFALVKYAFGQDDVFLDSNQLILFK